MRGLLTRLRYFARSTWLGLRTGPWTAAVSVATIAVTLVLVGAFALLLANMQALLDRFGESLVISAYLEPEVGPERGLAIAEQARALPGVAQVGYVSQDEALTRFRAGMGERSDLLDGLESNPLPASLEITLASGRTGSEAADLADALAALPGVEDLGWGHEWVEGYARAVGVVRGLALALGGVLGLAALLIVANTVRLALYSRRDEVEILLLVGASRTFVSVPFLLEGLVQGLLGGALALLLLYGVWALLLPGVAEALEFVLGHQTPGFLGLRGALALIATGAALGGLGAATALVQGWRR